MKGALLGLVLQKPGHGYDLANRLDRRLGPSWRIEPKSIYPMLAQLQRAGLVSSRRISHSGPTGQRVVYQPTGEAADAMTAWMATFSHRGPLRGELQVKIAVARSEDVPLLLVALDSHERDCRELLAAAEEQLPAVRSFAGLAMNLARAAPLMRLRAELEWIELARREIAEFRRSATLSAARREGRRALAPQKTAPRRASATTRAPASAAR